MAKLARRTKVTKLKVDLFKVTAKEIRYVIKIPEDNIKSVHKYIRVCQKLPTAPKDNEKLAKKS